jgi:hypothetical protein
MDYEEKEHVNCKRRSIDCLSLDAKRASGIVRRGIQLGFKIRLALDELLV